MQSQTRNEARGVATAVVTRCLRVRRRLRWAGPRRILISLLGAAAIASALRAASRLVAAVQVLLFTSPAASALKPRLTEAWVAFLAALIPMVILFLLTVGLALFRGTYHKLTPLGVLSSSAAFSYWFLAALLLVLWKELNPVLNLPFLLPPIIAFLGFQLVRTASRTFAKARQHMLRTADEVLELPGPPPLLYLRPFAADAAPAPPEFDMAKRESEMWTITNLKFWTERRELTFEEVLCRGLSEISPVIAIGRPGERLPRLGAARKYVADDQWQDEVSRLVEACSIVCILAGHTKGVVWEVLHVVATCPPEKILLLLPPKLDEGAWSLFFHGIGAQALPLPRDLPPDSLALAFGPATEVLSFCGKAVPASYAEIARCALLRLPV